MDLVPCGNLQLGGISLVEGRVGLGDIALYQCREPLRLVDLMTFVSIYPCNILMPNSKRLFGGPRPSVTCLPEILFGHVNALRPYLPDDKRPLGGKAASGRWLT